jgi:hypothetical protein
VDKFTIKEAVNLVGDGATYRTIDYYKNIYTNDVERIGGIYYVNTNFIDKVKHNRTLKKIVEDKRTKIELLEEIAKLQNELENVSGTKIELLEEIAKLKEELENASTLDIADNERIEVFTEEEYNTFSERLIEWRSQRKEIETQKEYFKDLKEEREYLKSQIEYFKISNDKILEQHERLIEIIGQRNRIEAVEKSVIPREI